jgi:hypothetical protein
MQVWATVKNKSGLKTYVLMAEADAKKVYRHILSADDTQLLKTPDMAIFDDEGCCTETTRALVIPIRGTLVTVHCRQPIQLGKSYKFAVTHRWYASQTPGTSVCNIRLEKLT